MVTSRDMDERWGSGRFEGIILLYFYCSILSMIVNHPRFPLIAFAILAYKVISYNEASIDFIFILLYPTVEAS